MMDRAEISHDVHVPAELAFQRLDQVAAAMFPQYSRSRLQAWIRSGELTVDGRVLRPRDKVSGGERVVISAMLEPIETAPETMELRVVHEDPHVLVIDKPPGLVVHPGAGNRAGTLANGLLAGYPELAVVPRAGIVHRLDKDTSGLLVVARTIESQQSLVDQLQARTVTRRYEAVVHGVPPVAGTVDAPISRHPSSRTRMTVMAGGREAITDYERLEAFALFARMAFSLRTGRTHQIRVHMQHIGFPLVGDPVYGRRGFRTEGVSRSVLETLRAFPRQALHARHLAFDHPSTGERVSYSSPLPGDFRTLLDALYRDRDRGC